VNIYQQLRGSRIATLLLSFGLFCGILSTLPTSAQAQQSNETLDRIIAVVNDHIILKSEVDQRVAEFLQSSRQQGQEVPFSKRLWYDAMESIVDKYVLLDQAKIDSVTVSDEQVNRQLNQRIDQLIQRAGSQEALENAFGKSLVQIRSQYREQFRQDIIVQKMRQNVMTDVSITRPEVRDYFNDIPTDSLPMVPERVGLAQIVRIPPPAKDARQKALKLAQQLRDSVTVYDKDFEALARRWSDGPSSSRGGRLPMMAMSDLVPEYSAAAAALQPGEISKVVETSYGFHIIRLNKRVGKKIDTNHILISIDDDARDEQAAISKLEAIRDSVVNGENKFGEMARKYSEDKQTAQMGGKLFNPQTGERMIALQNLDPALYRVALLLTEEGQVSEPKPFTPDRAGTKKAFRIVQLQKRVPEHRANLDDDYDMIEQTALQQKQAKRMQSYLEKLRDEMYVKYKIPRPDTKVDVADQL
jgi:peptidyl-prolyl cis-trans isomerase SurA